jgi:Bacterial membrane protein YfhO
MRRHPILVATFLYLLIAVALSGPALLGRASLAPDQLLDWDPLYRTGAPPPYPKLLDFTPTVMDLPRDLAFARGLHQGRFDNWNPLSAGGVPLWFEQGGALFPLKAVFYVAPSRRTYDLFLTLRLVVAALGAFLLARRRGLDGAAAFVAGAAFELSGPLVATLPFGAGSAVYLLPWVILASFAVAERRTARAAAGAGVALGIMASTGHPTLILLISAAFGAAMIGHALRAWRRPRALLGMAACVGIAVALGAALAAPSLLPLAELRSVGASYKERPIGERMQRLNLASSRSDAGKALLASAPLGTLPEAASAIDLTPCMGALAVFLAIAGILFRRPDPALACVAILGVVLALGPPGTAFIRELPGARLILPLYAWPLILLGVAQAAGEGVEVLRRANAARAGSIALAGLLALALVLRLASADGGLFHTLAPVLAAAAVLAACLLARRTPLGRFAGVALAILVTFEQLLSMRAVALFPASTVLSSPPSPAVEFLQARLATNQARMVAIPYVVAYPFTPMLFGLRDLRGHAALGVRRYHDYLSAVGIPGGILAVYAVRKTRSPLLDLAAVRYVVLPAASAPASVLDSVLLAVAQRPAHDDADLPVVYEDARVVIHENRNALPRARIVHRAIRVAGEAEARDWAMRFKRESRPAADLGIADTVMLEPGDRGEEPPRVSGEASARESARLVDERDPDRVRIQARLDDAGYLVLADTYYPGWEALVDGERAPIFPADLMFRAVHVAAGEHTIEFRYRPASFRRGLMLFACGLVAMALLLWQGFPSRRRAGRVG